MTTTATPSSTRPAGYIPPRSAADEATLHQLCQGLAVWIEAGNARKVAEYEAEISNYCFTIDARACRRIYHKLQWMILDGQQPERHEEFQMVSAQLLTMAAWLTAQIKD